MPLRGCSALRDVLQPQLGVGRSRRFRDHLRAPYRPPALGAPSALGAKGRATASPLAPRERRRGRGAADPAHARQPVTPRTAAALRLVSRGAVGSVRNGRLHRRGVTAERYAVARTHAPVGEAVCRGGVRQVPPWVVAHLVRVRVRMRGRVRVRARVKARVRARVRVRVKVKVKVRVRVRLG